MTITMLTLVSHPISNNFISKFQSLCGVDSQGRGKNRLFDYTFKLWSALGEEIFCLLPFLLWFAFPLGIRFMTNFGIILVSGQLMKEYFKLPRPPKSSVAKLERSFETEYGLPSTHTVTAILPMAILYAIEHHLGAVDTMWWRLSWIHVLLTGLSRMYVGVHSPADIIAGAMLGFSLTRVLDIHGENVDQYLYSTTSGLSITLISLFSFLFLYPKSIPWRVCYGTTAQIYGTWLGASLSFYMIFTMFPFIGRILEESSVIHFSNAWYHTHLYPTISSSYEDASSHYNTSPSSSMSSSTSSSTAASIHHMNTNTTITSSSFPLPPSSYIILLKLLLGLPIVGVAKFVVKKLSMQVFMTLYEWGYIHRTPGEEMDPFKQPVPLNRAYCIEIPVKIINYACISTSVILVTPLVWHMCGLHV